MGRLRAGVAWLGVAAMRDIGTSSVDAIGTTPATFVAHSLRMRIAIAGVLVFAFTVILSSCAAGGPTQGDPDGGAIAESGTGGDGGNGGEASTTTVDQACKANATGYCQRLQQCFPFSIKVNWGDVATCIATVGPACAQVLRAPGDGWTPDKLVACVDARDKLACGDFLLRKPDLEPCKITGAFDDGAACRYGPQCKSGYCRIASGVCGNCVTPVARGGACSTYSDCAADLLCAKNGTCQPPVDVTSACDDTKPCRLGNACIAGFCVAPKGENADCDPALNGTDCDYYQQLYCNAVTKKCTKYATAKAGDSCNVPNQVTACEAGGGCLNGTCAAAGVASTLCDPSKGITCAYPLTCDTGTCRLVDPAECK